MDMTRHEQWLRAPFVVVIAMAGSLAVAVVVLAPVPTGLDVAAERFLRSPQTVPWLAVLLVQGGVWALCGLALWARVRLLGQHWHRHRAWATVSTGLIVLLAAGPTLAPFVFGAVDSPLPGHTGKMIILNLVGIAVAVPGIIGISLIDSGTSSDFAQPEGTVDEVFRLAEARQHLARFGSLLGVIVGLAMLSSGGLRNALSSWSGEEVFPIEMVWLYGAHFSLLLALVYVPAYLRLLGIGNRLAEEICPAPTRSADPSSKPADLLKEHAECRGKIETTLGLHVSAAESFRTAAFISSPLAAAMVSSLAGLRL